MFHVERHRNVSVLRMDDGKVNAMSPAFLDAFPKAWAEATREGLAVVLAGNARVFGAGLDLKALPGLSRDQQVEFTRRFMGAFRDVLSYRRPTVAAVDGPAIAGGAVLALACDYRVVSARARMGVTEVPVGIPFPGPVQDLVALRLPTPEAREAILRGAIRDGADCLTRGWADRFASEGACVQEAIDLADELHGHSAHAYSDAKARMNGAVAHAFDGFEKEGAPAWVEHLHHPETQAALLRTLEKLARR